MPRRASGLKDAVKAFFVREMRDVHAVRDVSFRIEDGERVGFLGPNGAGKTTTLKMLAGLLHPTAGSLLVDGFEPKQRNYTFLERITLVLGQKQQLLWDLPPADTFELNRAIYRIPDDRFRAVVGELSEMLALGDTVKRPTRQLSLGERMKCELVCALLHTPKVLFLDEPTIGLDVTMQRTVREFIRTYNERHHATVILTSHYMADVLALCPRVIVIDHGKIRYDGTIAALVHEVQPEKRVTLRLERAVDASILAQLGTLVAPDAHAVASELDVTYRVPQADTSAVVSRLLAQLPVADLVVADPPLEDVLGALFEREPRPSKNENGDKSV